MYGFVINPHLDYTDKIIQKLKSLHEQREKKKILRKSFKHGEFCSLEIFF